jgi:hypothetical protein
MKVEVHSERDDEKDDLFTSVLVKFSTKEVAAACEAEPGLPAILQAKPHSPSDLLDKFLLMARVLERTGTTTTNNQRVKTPPHRSYATGTYVSG